MADTQAVFPQVSTRFGGRIGLFRLVRPRGICAGQARIGVSFLCGYAHRVGQHGITTLSTSAKEG